MFLRTSALRSANALKVLQLEDAAGIGFLSIHPLVANMKKSSHAPYFRSMFRGSSAGIGTADCAPSGAAARRDARSRGRIIIGRVVLEIQQMLIFPQTSGDVKWARDARCETASGGEASRGRSLFPTNQLSNQPTNRPTHPPNPPPPCCGWSCCG